MSKDILSDYGRDTSQRQVPRATNGGRQTPKPLEYCPPVGPKGINDPKTPGINGTNHGNNGTQGRH